MEYITLWTRDYGVQYAEIFMVVHHMRNPFGYNIKRGIWYPQNGNETYYITLEDFEKINERIEELLKNESEMQKKVELFEKYGREYANTTKEISKMDLKNLGNNELFKLYEQFREIWTKFTSYLWVMFQTNELFTKRAEELLEEKSKEMPDEKFKKLVIFAATPEDVASILKLNKELSRMKISKEEENLEKIRKEYEWIPCLDIHNEPWDKKHFLEYYKEFTPSQEKEGVGARIDEFELDEQERRRILLGKKLAYIRDLRDEYRRIGMYHIQKLYEEIGKRMNLTTSEMSFVRDVEVKAFFEKGVVPNKEIVNKRISGFLMFMDGEKIECLVGEEIKEKAQELELRVSEEEGGRIIKGKTASKGKVQGRVRVILTVKDLNKVSKGDILVAVTTGADYVPAMHRAAAFVTDEGGLTCHAAIIAREMKKPCIVGTKNATKILKDGEIVEVDCETGTVRKV